MTNEQLSETFKSADEICKAFPDLATPMWRAGFVGSVIKVQKNWGGPHVLSWWILQRISKDRPLSKAEIKRLARMAGSEGTFRKLVGYSANAATDSRLAKGWSFLQVTAYIDSLLTENA